MSAQGSPTSETAASAKSGSAAHSVAGNVTHASSEASTSAVQQNGNGGASSGEEASHETSTKESRSSDPNASLSLRALVSTKEAGVIIGKGGSNVAELRDKTGVKAGVSKVVPGVHDRVLSVNGTMEGVASAYSIIAQTILDNPVTNEPATNTSGTTSVRILISHALMGTVIGKAGLTIKHIQDLSGARMVASKEMLPSSTERIVEVQGTPASIKIAVQEIAKCLLDDWERGQGTVLYQPEQTDGAGVLAASGMGGLQQQGPYPARGGAGGPRRASGPNYLNQAMGGLTLGAGPIAPPGVGDRRSTVPAIVPEMHPAAMHPAAVNSAAVSPAAMNPAAMNPAAVSPGAVNSAAVHPAAAAMAVAPAAANGAAAGGMDLLANPTTAPYAAHVASLQHQSVFAPTGIPAGSATRPSAIADAAAQGAAVAPGGGLVAGGMTGAGPATAPAVVDAANLRTQNISIPSDMVGCIIGKGGSKITEIRRLSGSRISIAKVAHDETGERMFTIQGTPESNEKALFLLYNQLETEKERRTASGATVGGAPAV